MYSKLETCLIFRNCKSREDVIRAGSAFGHLSKYGEQVPKYAVWYANIRFRNLMK